MEITVIIPVRNRALMLPATLDSVAAQTLRTRRLIIVDNGSDDGSPEVAAKWSAAHPDLDVVMLAEPKPGASAARNRGLAEVSKADDSYVLFFDSDDIMLPDHIARIDKALEARPDTDLLYFDKAFRDPDGWTTVKSTPGDGNLICHHIFHSTLATASFVARASLVERAGGWNEELLRWNDYELGLRLAVEASSPFKLTGAPRVMVLTHSESITGCSYSKDAATLNAALDSMRRTLAAASLTQELRYLHARRAILAGLFAREGDAASATSTMRQALDAASPRDTLAMRLAYLATRLTGRGGAAMASWLLAPPKPKRATRLSRPK